MSEVTKLILYPFFAGITVFIGGLLSVKFEKFKNHSLQIITAHTLTGFGAGILIAAVAFVLLPKGITILNLIPLTLFFLAGVIFFGFLDLTIQKKGGALAQMMAMLMDFIPEAIALGAIFAHDIKLGLLLAIFIGLQNLPESFNAYLELKKFIGSSKKILVLFFFLSFSGIIAALLGDFLLSDKPQLIAELMVFSGGGIVFLMFQDIAPLAKLKNSWLPTMGASIGFLVGVVGNKLLG